MLNFNNLPVSVLVGWRGEVVIVIKNKPANNKERKYLTIKKFNGEVYLKKN
jgi:hypothetical protein